MNWPYLIDAIPKFVDAAKLTLELSAYGIVLSLLFGLPVAVVTAYRIRPFYALAQAWAVAVPAIGANVLFLMKETSIVSAVGIAELLFVTKDIIGMDYKTNEALFLLFASYLIILLPVSLLARWAENRVRSAKYGG